MARLRIAWTTTTTTFCRTRGNRVSPLLLFRKWPNIMSGPQGTFQLLKVIKSDQKDKFFNLVQIKARTILMIECPKPSNERVTAWESGLVRPLAEGCGGGATQKFREVCLIPPDRHGRRTGVKREGKEKGRNGGTKEMAEFRPSEVLRSIATWITSRGFSIKIGRHALVMQMYTGVHYYIDNRCFVTPVTS